MPFSRELVLCECKQDLPECELGLPIRFFWANNRYASIKSFDIQLIQSYISKQASDTL